ncbi:uncharacterized protein BKA78DRAFT_325137 [Phyllosticta capitalensis]|uniref:uncharacterized protein n=1 Tax=Phyllosticta capitalensis TaxID=121624 RepID=UPI0031310F6E
MSVRTSIVQRTCKSSMDERVNLRDRNDIHTTRTGPSMMVVEELETEPIPGRFPSIARRLRLIWRTLWFGDLRERDVTGVAPQQPVIAYPPTASCAGVVVALDFDLLINAIPIDLLVRRWVQIWVVEADLEGNDIATVFVLALDVDDRLLVFGPFGELDLQPSVQPVLPTILRIEVRDVVCEAAVGKEDVRKGRSANGVCERIGSYHEHHDGNPYCKDLSAVSNDRIKDRE